MLLFIFIDAITTSPLSLRESLYMEQQIIFRRHLLAIALIYKNMYYFQGRNNNYKYRNRHVLEIGLMPRWHDNNKK